MIQSNSSFLRFLIGGAFNTAVTYVLFLFLSSFLHHLIAYTVVYAFGIVLSYVLNTIWVFRTGMRWQTAAAFPLVYVTQYIWGIAVLYALVDGLGWRSEIAMIIVIASSVLLTYAVMRRLLRSAAA